MEAGLAPSAVTLTDTGEPQLESCPALCRDFAFMKHVLLRPLCILIQKQGRLYIYYSFLFWGLQWICLVQLKSVIRETTHWFFITKEGEKQVEDFFFFFPRSQFPREMRPIPLSCMWRERSGSHTIREHCPLNMPHFWDDVWECAVKIWGRELAGTHFFSSAAEDLWDRAWGHAGRVAWNL